MVMKYILAMDQGTTSSRAVIFDHDAGIRSIAQKELRQIRNRGENSCWAVLCHLLE